MIQQSFIARVAALSLAAWLSPSPASSSSAECDPEPTGNGAIFFHPDGTSAGHWDAMRILYHGPDAGSQWDRLPAMAPYRGNIADRLTSSSNAGATIHATGTRAWVGSFGLDKDGDEIRSADGSTDTIMEKAVDCGLGTALIQTGSLIEPGTAAFVSEADNRYEDVEEIALEVIESGVDILLGAGEEWLLPEGTEGQFGEGRRTDGRNLIAEASESGYAVVYTREQLLELPEHIDRVLGVFNVEDTFFDRPEEELRAAGLPNYLATAPTVAEMTAFALERISDDEDGFLAVIEEEGSDNFCNKMNASGCLEAMKRADDANAVMLDFIAKNPDTFMVTTSDSNAGGIQIRDMPSADQPVPARAEYSGAALDGRDGTGTLPFVSAPDRTGTTFPFAIAWASGRDIGSGVIARGAGREVERLVPSSGVANTDIYRMLYYTLFGEMLPPAGSESASAADNGDGESGNG